MSLKISQCFFCFSEQLIKSGRPHTATATVHPLSVRGAKFFIYGAVHGPEIAYAKFIIQSNAYIAAMRGVQAIMQALPISQVHMLF